MARTVLTPLEVSRDGVALAAGTTGDAVNGHSVANDGNVRLVLKNTNGSTTSHTATFHIVGQVDGSQVPARVETIAAGATEEFGPFPTTEYGNPLLIDLSSAEVHIDAYHG